MVGQFGTRTIWHKDGKNGQFGTKKANRQFSTKKANRQFGTKKANRQFGTKIRKNKFGTNIVKMDDFGTRTIWHYHYKKDNLAPQFFFIFFNKIVTKNIEDVLFVKYFQKV